MVLYECFSTSKRRRRCSYRRAQALLKNYQNTNDEGDASEYNFYSLVNEVPDNFKNLISEREPEKGDIAAKNFISINIKNLDWNENSLKDTWTEQNLYFSRNFYEQTDSEIDDDSKYYSYYEVILTETPKHFFRIFDSFGDMNIKVNAVAKLSRIFENPDDIDHGPNLIEQMEKIKEVVVYRQYYEIMDEYKKFIAKEKETMQNKIQIKINEGMSEEDAKNLVESEWKEDFIAKYILTGKTLGAATQVANDYFSDKNFSNTEDPAFKQSDDRIIISGGNFWLKNLTTHSTEGLTVFGLGGPSWKINQYTIDNMFIDFRYDVSCKFTSDWDLTLPPPSGLTYSSHNKIFDDKKDPDNIRVQLSYSRFNQRRRCS